MFLGHEYPPLTAKVNSYFFGNSRGITPERKKVVKSKIELDLPFMVPVSDWYINFK